MPEAATSTIGDPFQVLRLAGLKVEGLGPLLGHVLGTLSQAVVLYGAFQDMRGKRVNLGKSMEVGLRRFFPVVGVAISTTLLGFLGLIAFVVPGLMCFTMWFVATPACVVEGRGVFSSLARSARLTRGHGWKIFGLMLLLYFCNAIVDSPIDQALSGIPAFAGHVIWNGIGTRSTPSWRWSPITTCAWPRKASISSRSRRYSNKASSRPVIARY